MNKYTRGIEDGQTLEDWLFRMNRLHTLFANRMLHGLGRMPEGAISGMADELSEEQVPAYMDWAENLSRWVAGDYIATMKQEKGANAAYRHYARLTGKSERWSLELSRVALLFDPSQRYYGVPWQLYRVCAGSPKPMSTLLFCVRRGISPKSISAEMVSHREATGLRHGRR